MKRLLSLTLGVLTAVGGFVDIGDFVTNALTGARFGMGLAWAVVLGAVGIVVYAEMAGRVATVSGRPVFDLVRERLGVRAALVNLGASFVINLLTLVAEIAGLALALQLATDVNHLLWIPIVGFLVWFYVWRVRFETMERTFGLLGLLLLGFAVALWQLGPDWGRLAAGALHPSMPSGEGHPTYLYYAVALFGAAMTPYEVFFFSSGAVEEHWTQADLIENKLNVLVGFPLGALLSLAIMATASVVLQPQSIEVDHLSQAVLPVAVALGKLGVAAVLVGAFAAFSGAALETLLSAGYTVAQFLGWRWGKYVAPRDASRFHIVMLATLFVAMAIGLTGIDAVKVTEYSVVLSAAALPLTYFPILVVANDHDYMGDRCNGRFTNAIASVYLVLLLAVSLATIPLMLTTKAGQ